MMISYRQSIPTRALLRCVGLVAVAITVRNIAQIFTSSDDIILDIFQPASSPPVWRNINNNESSSSVGRNTGSSSATAFLNESSFLYAKMTYRYRYSNSRFREQYPIHKYGNSILPLVIYGVCADAATPLRRHAFRNTLGKEAPVYFLVAGKWEFISKEFIKFGDMIWIDIPEDYRDSLTPKTFAFIQFASRIAMPGISLASGRPVEYMFKTDDDVYVNATEMSRELLVHGPLDYYGLLKTGSVAVGKGNYDPSHPWYKRWYLSREEYPRDTYASGIGYALSKAFGDCATRAMASTMLIPMPWEDVATGLLAEACGIEATSSADEWSHFGASGNWELDNFPYWRHRNGNVTVKILHKVEPPFFVPLSVRGPLVEMETDRRKGVWQAEQRWLQRYVQEPEQQASTGSSFVNESLFLYANTTYQYRYSDSQFGKRYYPTRRDGNSSLLPSVLYGVCADAAKPYRRHAIRNTLGKEAPVYFLVAGKWDSISKEFIKFGDMIWIDIPEDYRDSLTPKTFAFIQFASRIAMPGISLASGRPVEYMFKTDDDVYVNATEMGRELLVHGPLDYYGLLKNGSIPAREEHGDPLNKKWILSREEYPRETFPAYCRGIGYALSKAFGDCATRAMASTMLIPMPWEDVATGLLAEACGVEATSSADEWSHLLVLSAPPTSMMEWELNNFPYDRLKNGNVTVKILHKVEPPFFVPLSVRGPLVEVEADRRKELAQAKERWWEHHYNVKA